MNDEVRVILNGLLQSLTEVRNQRSVTPLRLPEDRAKQLKRQGEIDGLNIAIAAIRRRMH